MFYLNQNTKKIYFGCDHKNLWQIYPSILPHDNFKSIIFGQITTDETDHSAHVQSDAEQRNNITNSAILKLYSAVTHFFSLPNSCAIMYFDIRDAHMQINFG